MATALKIVVLPGDGIGPEIATEAIRVLHAVEENFSSFSMDFQFHDAIPALETGAHRRYRRKRFHQDDRRWHLAGIRKHGDLASDGQRAQARHPPDLLFF